MTSEIEDFDLELSMVEMTGKFATDEVSSSLMLVSTINDKMKLSNSLSLKH